MNIDKYMKVLVDFFNRKKIRRKQEELKKEAEIKAEKERVKKENQPKKEIPFPKIPIGTSRAEVERLMEEYRSQVLAQKEPKKSEEDVKEKVIISTPGETEGSELTFKLLKQNMEKKSLIKTIIICITAIVCVSIGSYVYFDTNRYKIDDRAMIDKFTKEVYIYDEQSRSFRR